MLLRFGFQKNGTDRQTARKNSGYIYCHSIKSTHFIYIWKRHNGKQATFLWKYVSSLKLELNTLTEHWQSSSRATSTWYNGSHSLKYGVVTKLIVLCKISRDPALGFLPPLEWAGYPLSLQYVVADTLQMLSLSTNTMLRGFIQAQTNYWRSAASQNKIERGKINTVQIQCGVTTRNARQRISLTKRGSQVSSG